MAKKPGVAAAKGIASGKPKKVKLSGAPASYTGKSGITQEVKTKVPSKGRASRRGY